METALWSDPEYDGMSSIRRHGYDSRQEMRRKYPEMKEEIGHFRSIDPCKTETALEGVDIPCGFFLPPVVMKSSVIPLTVSGRLPCLSPAFTLITCSAYCSFLKMEATCCSETSLSTGYTALSQRTFCISKPFVSFLPLLPLFRFPLPLLRAFMRAFNRHRGRQFVASKSLCPAPTEGRQFAMRMLFTFFAF
jgi:hypothetical protein